MSKVKETKRIDLGNGYMVIEADGWYSIVTPTTSIVIPKEQFRGMIARYAHTVTRSPSGH